MVGKTANNFKLIDQNGKEFDLYENLDKNILIIFYPKDNSHVCSRQLNNYQLKTELFSDKKVKLVGINIDNVESHKGFCEEIGIDFPLLFDENKAVSREFKALNILGMNKRKLVLIGPDKKILFEENLSYLKFPTAEELVARFDFLNI